MTGQRLARGLVPTTFEFVTYRLGYLLNADGCSGGGALNIDSARPLRPPPSSPDEGRMVGAEADQSHVQPLELDDAQCTIGRIIDPIVGVPEHAAPERLRAPVESGLRIPPVQPLHSVVVAPVQ